MGDLRKKFSKMWSEPSNWKKKTKVQKDEPVKHMESTLFIATTSYLLTEKMVN